MSRSRLLAVAAFAVAAVAVSFGLYRVLPAGPQQGHATAGFNPSAEPGTERRPGPDNSKAAIGQTSDFGRNPKTRAVQDLDGATIRMCRHELFGKKLVQERVENSCGGIADSDVVGMQLCRRALDSDYAYLQEVTAKTAGCPETLVRVSAYYEALRDAALAGDVDALECFLAGYFEDRDSGDYLTQAQRDEYPSVARQFIQSAFERGDWGLVHRLAGGYVDNPGMLIHAYPYGSGYPETSYKMNYLITLSSGDEAGLDEARRTVDALRSIGRLSAAQIQAAEEWARETYDRYFAATPYNAEVARSSFCETVIGTPVPEPRYAAENGSLPHVPESPGPEEGLDKQLMAEIRDDAWAPIMELDLGNYLARHPDPNALGSPSIECRATLCRVQTVVDAEIYHEAFPDADLRTAMDNIQGEALGRELVLVAFQIGREQLGQIVTSVYLQRVGSGGGSKP